MTDPPKKTGGFQLVEKVLRHMSFSAVGRKRPGENSCFPPNPFSAFEAFSAASP